MGNPVGSLEVPMTLRARKHLLLSMTPRQKDILVGCILGDAHITPLGKIRIEHSIKQRAYVDWKRKELQSLCYSGIPREIIHVYRQKRYRSVFFLLRQYFRIWRQLFYPCKKKIFPKDLQLNPLALAVWYMDDGCWTGKKILISTESFRGESMSHLQDVLFRQLNIETIASSNGKLVIRKKSHEIFCNLISPYVIESMRYKLPNRVTT